MPESCEHLKRRGGWAEDRLSPDCRFPVGPWNTWSNIAYGVVGCWLAWRYQDSASAAMAVALMALMTGSALYHGYKSLNANRLDWVGMFMVFGALVAHGWFPTVASVSWLMLACGGLLVAWYGHRKWMSADWMLGVCLALSAVWPVVWGRYVPVVVSLGLFALAYLAWHLDKARHPLVGKYGHAIWHVLTAVAIGVLYVAQV